MDAAVDGAIVLLLGALVGVAELVSRYRDDPWRAIQSRPAVLYVLVNAGAALGALLLARVFGWTFGVSTGGEAARWTQVLVAGTGAMVLFRSSLFTVKVGDQDVAIGPSSFLQIILHAFDRGVDRLRGQQRSQAVARLMKDVSFDKAGIALPVYCAELLQNLPAEDAEELTKKPGTIATMAVTEQIKALLLGLAILNATGEDVLAEGVQALRTQIAAGGGEAPPPNQ